MHIPDEALDRVRNDGYAVVEDFLSARELDAARSAMFELYPTPADYFADPEQYAHLTRHPFAGLRVGPYASWDLSRLAIHPDLVDAAERFCGTVDLDLYKIELWAKYSGSIDYDQDHHGDYDNHTLVVPRRDGRWPQLTTFILLSDVDEDDGPTKVLPRSIGDDVPLVPNPNTDRSLRDHEVSITGPAGSIFMYYTDVLHRGSTMTGTERSRFALLADYQARGNPWMGKVSWPGRAKHPIWDELMTRATPRERDLFGFPPPGHEYWNEQTLRDVGTRWPGIDLDPYRTAVR
jgi:hypothetical protein